MDTNNFFNVFSLEGNSISKVKEIINKDHVKSSLSLMKNCKGKFLLIGLGKSGIIAKKIAATLNSIGEVSIFLHPSEALHGDFGIANSSDVAIIVSNSGETGEIINILPYLKIRNVNIIAITKSENSTLGKNADEVIDYQISEEADKHNIVPTISTTISLVIGDALAIALMEAKSVTPKKFAYNHPSGTLGKKLTLKVKDIMYKGERNPVVKSNCNWLSVIEAMNKDSIGAANVIDNNNKLVGIITDGDIRRTLKKTNPNKIQKIKSKDIMTKNPITVNLNLLAYDALKLMEKNSNKISVLSVVNENNTSVGIVKLADLNNEFGSY